MKHRTDLRRAHRRIRSLEHQLALSRHSALRLSRLVADAQTAAARARRDMFEWRETARGFAAEPFWRIAARRLRTWLEARCQ